MATTEQIIAVLQGMDPANDDQWTTNGLARMDYVEAALGENVDRRDLNGAWTGFNRGVLAAWKAEQTETAGEGSTDDSADATPAPEPETADSDGGTDEGEPQEAPLAPNDPARAFEPVEEDDTIPKGQTVETPAHDDEPEDTYLPAEWGGRLVNPLAGPASAAACDDGFDPDDTGYYGQCYAVWMEQRVYLIERTTTGETPKFPAD